MKYIIFLFLLVSSVFSQDITVTIVYGENKADRVVETTFKSGETALAVLQKVADVKVANGKYKFVRSIDGHKSIKGVYGWFYFINDESTHKMANRYELNDDVLSMTWLYKVEQCN